MSSDRKTIDRMRNYLQYVLFEVQKEVAFKNQTEYVFGFSIKHYTQVPVKNVSRISSPNELTNITAERPAWYARLISDRLERGDICFVAKDGGAAVSCIWLTFGSTDLPDVEYDLKFAENEVGIIDAYTIESARGRGYYEHVFHACLNYLKEVMPAATVLGFIVKDNLRSLKVHFRLGATQNLYKITLRKYAFLRIRRKIILGPNDPETSVSYCMQQAERLSASK